jgi:hypothetical protein
MSDDRLKKSAQPEPQNADRSSRAMQDRAVTERREISDDERLEMLKIGTAQIKLPNLPTISGYHTCWLSTNNPSDTIAWRQQMGYELLTPADVPGWVHGNCANDQYSSFVGVNEMLGAKIRVDLYNRIMQYMHHDEPHAMESGIRSQIESVQSEAATAGGRVDIEDGMKDLGKSQQAPTSW